MCADVQIAGALQMEPDLCSSSTTFWLYHRVQINSLTNLSLLLCEIRMTLHFTVLKAKLDTYTVSGTRQAHKQALKICYPLHNFSLPSTQVEQKLLHSR